MRSLNYIAAVLPVISSAYAGNALGDDYTIVTQTRTITYCPVVDWFTCDENSYGPTSERTGGPSTSKPTTTADVTTSGKSTTTTWSDPDYTTRPTTRDGSGSISIITSTESGSVITTTTGGDVITTTRDGTIITTSHEGTIITTTGTDGSISISTSHGGIITTTNGGSIITTTTGGDVITTTNGGTTITSTSIIDPDTTTHHGGNGTVTTSGDHSLITTTSGFGGNGTTSTGISTSSGYENATTTSGCFNSTRTAAPFSFDRAFVNNCNRPGSRDQWCDGKTIQSDTQPQYSTGQTRRYRLEIGLGQVDADASGTALSVFTINGKTPGDPIIANWGDMVEITVVNTMDPASGPVNATTIHWHGILQHGTNDQDGVPGVTECGIAPGSSRTYTWLASTYGTSWYHSHLLSQYGGGVRGPIIIHGPASSDYDLDMGSVMIDEKFPSTIFDTGKFYATQRGVVVASNYLLNGKNLNRLDPNKGEAARWIVKSGKKHLFRIINSSAQSGFVFHIDNHKMTVISADMTPIVPYETENLWIHSGQRYNVIVKADQPIAAYDVRAIVQQGCGTSIANTGLGQSNGVLEYEGSCYTVPSPSNFTLNTATLCQDEPLSSLVPVVRKGAGSQGEFGSNVLNLPAGTLGNAVFNGTAINRWFFGAPLNFTGTASGTATKGINVTFDMPTLQMLPTVGNYGDAVYGNTVFYYGKNQWVYWIIQNAFITSHPMHLHGHDFAVLGQAYNAIFDSSMVNSLNFDNPMRRDTVLLYGKGGTPVDPTRVPGYTVIGFQTDNPGAWLMHCHIIWHADLGMGIQIVERPDDMPNYYSKPDFQSECSAYKNYEAGGPGRVKAQYESGLKIRDGFEGVARRHLDEHKFHGYSHGHAVRHA